MHLLDDVDTLIDGDLGDPRGTLAVRTRASAFREHWRERHPTTAGGSRVSVRRLAAVIRARWLRHGA